MLKEYGVEAFIGIGVSLILFISMFFSTIMTANVERNISRLRSELTYQISQTEQWQKTAKTIQDNFYKLQSQFQKCITAQGGR